MSVPARVAVVGAGIVGVATAHALAARGAEVVLVDDDRAGRATSAGAGIIAPGSDRLHPALAAFVAAAVAHHPRLVEQIGAAGLEDSSYGVAGELVVALDDGEAAAIADNLRVLRELVDEHGAARIGAPQEVPPREVAQRHPLLGPVTAAVWLPDVGRLDGRVLRERLLDLAARAGARVVRGSASLVEGGALRLDGEPLPADAVVVAAGAWSADLLAEVGVPLGVAPQRGQIVHLRLPGASALPAVSTLRGHYLLSFPGDRLVVGATRETGSGFDPRVTVAGVEQVLAQGRSLVPSLDQATWLEARVGLRPLSDDGLPHLGPVADVPGLWVATGLGANGLTLGPWSGEVLARALCGERGELPVEFAPR